MPSSTLSSGSVNHLKCPFYKKKEQNGKYRKYETIYVLFLDVMYHFNDRTPEHLLLHTLSLVSVFSHSWLQNTE